MRDGEQKSFDFQQTPLEAARLVITAESSAGSITDLERLSGPGEDVMMNDLEVFHGDQEELDTIESWSVLPLSPMSQSNTMIVLLSNDKELKSLQHHLVIEDISPDYQATRKSFSDQFRPYRVSGRPDDKSEERAERIAQLLEKQFGTVGMPAEGQHLRTLLKVKHLAFAKTPSDCKQNWVVVCDPNLIDEPPNTVRRSKIQALSPPQKEFLHKQVRDLIDNGFLVKIDEDKVQWISETRIVPKPAREIDANISLKELQCQVNALLKSAGLNHDPNMPEPSPFIVSMPTADTNKAKYQLVHNYAPINHYMRDTTFVPGDISVKASKLANKQYLFKGDGCAGFFIVVNSPKATLLSVTYIEDLGFFGYTVMPFGFKVGPLLYYRFIMTAFGNLFDCDSDFWMDDVASGHNDFGAYFIWLRSFPDRVIDTGFTLSVNKCQFLHEDITFCGQLVSIHGVRIDPNQLKAIVNWPKPRTVQELMVFRGICSYL